MALVVAPGLVEPHMRARGYKASPLAFSIPKKGDHVVRRLVYPTAQSNQLLMFFFFLFWEWQHNPKALEGRVGSPLFGTLLSRESCKCRGPMLRPWYGLPNRRQNSRIYHQPTSHSPILVWLSHKRLLRLCPVKLVSAFCDKRHFMGQSHALKRSKTISSELVRCKLYVVPDPLYIH